MSQTPTAIAVDIQRGQYENRESHIPIVCYGTEYDGTGDRNGLTYTISVYHHPTGTPQNPLKDTVVDGPTEVNSDVTGQATVYWIPRTFPSGRHNSYYAVASCNGVEGIGRDFNVLNPGQMLLQELDDVLADLQRIPLRDEVSLTPAGDKSFRFASRLWRYDSPLYFMKDQSTELTFADIESIDYLDGTLHLKDSQPAGTEIALVEGYRQFFTDDQLFTFLDMALADVNILPPETAYSVDNYPGLWRSALVYGGQAHALTNITSSSTLREQLAMLVGPEAIGVLQSAAATIQGRLSEMRPQLKKRVMTGARVITSHDIAVPPRVTATTWQSYVYLRFGRAGY